MLMNTKNNNDKPPISLNKLAKNREPTEIMALLDLTIDSRFEIFGVEFSDYEMDLINRIRTAKLVIDTKLLHIFEAPLNPIDFKDLMNLVTNAIIESVFDEAFNNNVISEEEQKIAAYLKAKLII